MADLTMKTQHLELLFCACMDGGTTEDFLALAKQAEKIAIHLDPAKAKEILEANHMKGFLEPHHIGVIRNSGDLWVSRSRAGTRCYTYFAGKENGV